MLDLDIFKEYQQKPLGFVDIGSMGGIHELVEPISKAIKAICFEPDNIQAQKLRQMYKNDSKYFDVIIEEVALSNKNGKESLFVSKTPTNTSLLEPNTDFIKRYNAEKFILDKEIEIETIILDDILQTREFISEFIKIDTQGSEYQILKASPKTLESTLAIWCEVEFFHVYKNQPTFSDVDMLLRDYGFCIYGLYPNYRSKKTLNPKEFDTEERLMWADSIFFKDPLDSRNKNKSFSDREIKTLILIAIVTEFFDYALELTREYFSNSKDKESLENIIKNKAKMKREKLVHGFGNSSFEKNFMIKHFVDSYKSNSDLSYMIE